MYLNFAETNRDGRTLWTEQAYRRLQRIKASVDPYDVIRSNHPITPGSQRATRGHEKPGSPR